VPYLLIHAAPERMTWITAAVQPIAATEKTSGFEADLGATADVDMIDVEGLSPPYLKRLALEGSGDRERWTLLAPDATLFDLPAEQLRQHAIAFPPGPYRFLRVTWDDTNSGRVALPRGVFARRASATIARPPAPSIEAPFERRPSEPGRSRYRISLPAAGLPAVAVTLEAAGAHVFRTAAVTEASLQGQQAAPREIGRSILSRVVRDGVTASALRIPIAAPHEQTIDLVVEDGNNPPLDLTRVRIELAELPSIYFIAPGGPLTARYGDPSLAPPTYDLEAARDTIDVTAIPEARWDAPRETTPSAATSPPTPMPDAGAPLDPAGFRYHRPLPESSSGLVMLPLDASVLAHSRGAGRMFEDVRILDGEGRQVPYLVERLEEPLSLALALERFEARAADLRASGGAQHSVYRLALPYRSLPNAALVLETSARVFTRAVRAGLEREADRSHRDPWFEVIATKSWAHNAQDRPAPPLSLPIGTTREDHLVVDVNEGDNAPLPITSARLLLPSYRLRFYHPGRPLTLVYGRDDVSLPRYDLALLSAQVMGAEATEIAAAPAVDEAKPGPAHSLVSPQVFWAGLALAVLVIGGIIIRLVRT
jgi:hypothetical protein